MFAVQIKVEEMIKKAIVEKAHEIFEATQENCPIKTGRLKRSGSFYQTGNIVGLVYTAPYASLVEDGMKAGTRLVGAYITSKGKVVSAHHSYYSERPGRHFIKNAVDEGESTLLESVDSVLRNNFRVR